MHLSFPNHSGSRLLDVPMLGTNLRTGYLLSDDVVVACADVLQEPIPTGQASVSQPLSHFIHAALFM